LNEKFFTYCLTELKVSVLFLRNSMGEIGKENLAVIENRICSSLVLIILAVVWYAQLSRNKWAALDM